MRPPTRHASQASQPHLLRGPFLVGAWLIAAACSSTPRPPEPVTFPPDGPATPEAYCHDLAAPTCQRARVCEPAFFTGSEELLGGCLRTAEQRCLRSNRWFLADLTAGHRRFNGSAAADCVLQEATRGCEEQPGPACGRVFEGVVASGQACALDSECQRGFSCEPRPGTGGFCGTCQLRATSGYCLRDQACAEGMACAGGCIALLAAGDRCGSPGSGPCTPGTTCAQATRDDPPRCVQYGVEGAACWYLRPCMDGLVCQNLGDAGTVCVPLPQAGQHCAEASELGYACAGSYQRVFCNFETLTCDPYQLRRPGESCDAAGQMCLFPSFCALGICGEASCPNDECLGSPPAGSPCTTDCEGLDCANGKCAAWRCPG